MYIILFIVFLILLLLIVNSVVNWCYLHSTKKRIKKELLIEKTKIKAIKIEREYLRLKIKGRLDNYPYMNQYLKKVSELLEEGGMEFQNVTIQPIGTDEDFAKELMSEWVRLSKNKEKDILNIFNDESTLTEDIYQIKHPIKFRINNAKKNIMLHILHYLLKKVDKRKKKEIEKRSTQRKIFNENEVKIKDKHKNVMSTI